MALGLLAGGQAQAGVTLTCDKQYLLGGERCTLRATAAGGAEPVLRWRLEGQGEGGPRLQRASATEAWFTAPAELDGGDFTVVAEAERDPSLRGTLRFRARKLPGREPGGGAGEAVPALVPEAFAPALSWFLGEPTAEGAGPARLAFCATAFQGARDPAVRRLNRCWLVAGARGLQAFSPAGEEVPLPPFLQPAPGQAVHAVAVLPAVVDPPVHLPRLAVAVSGGTPGAPMRIFALGCEGVLWQWSPEGRTVRDLALDRDGQLLVGFSDHPELLRIDLAGHASPHARLPEAGAPDPDGGGIRAMVLDAASGDLYVGDRGGVWQISPAGVAARVLADPPLAPAELALCGRQLILVDGRRRALHGFHLDTGRRVTLLQGAGPARFGPVPGASPGEAGPLAITPEGWCLLAVGQGLATLALSGEEAVAEAPARAAARQPSQEGFWTLQGEIRSHEKKLLRLRRARPSRAEPHRARGIRRHKQALARLRQEVQARAAPAEPPPPETLPEAPTGSGIRPQATGLFCLAVLGLGALTDPGMMQALAQTVPVLPYGAGSFSFPSFAQDPAQRMAGYNASATAGLGQLDAVCAGPRVALLRIPACAAGARSGVQEQAAAIQAQMSELFVPPETLGAGHCLPGESLVNARERIALGQSGQLARFGLLNSDAGALSNQLARDANALGAVGAGLLGGSAIAAAVMPANATLLSAILGEALEEALVDTGNSLAIAASGLNVVSQVYGQVAAEALAYQARYQRWANTQNRILLKNCTGAAAGTASSPAVTPRPAAAVGLSPMPAMADALARLTAGCALVSQRGLGLPVCTPQSLSGFRQRNGTLMGLYGQAIPCQVVGLDLGDQAACPRTPLGDAARDRTDTFSYLDEFIAETSQTAAGLFGLGYGFLTGSEGLITAGAATLVAQAAATGHGLVAGSEGLLVIASWLASDGYDLLRIAAAMRGVQAQATLEFNAESLARLDQREALAAGGSAGGEPPAGTGAGPARATGNGTRGALQNGTAGPVSSTAPARPLSSSALRTRPFLPRWVFLWLL